VSRGAPVVPRFSTAERDRRYRLARDLMDEQGLDALLAYGERGEAGPPQFTPDTYFTNDRPGATVIFPRRGEPVALVWSSAVIGDHLEATARGEATWLRPSQIRTGRGADAIVRTLREEGLERGRIGVLGLEPHPPFFPEGLIPYVTWRRVLEALPGATFVPVQRRFSELTMARSPEEVEVLRWSARAGERMCEAMVAVTRPGALESDLYAAAAAACFASVANCYWLILLSGPGTLAWGPPAWTYRPQPPRQIREGDLVLAELFVTAGMLESQQQLTIAVGEVAPEAEVCARAAREAYEVGLRELRPGARFGDVVEAMDEPVRRVGGWNLTPHLHSLNPFGAIGRCGQGFRGQPGLEAYREVGALETTMPDLVLRPGMGFAFEPNCVLGRHRVNIGGTVVVGEDGPIEMNQICNRMVRV